VTPAPRASPHDAATGGDDMQSNRWSVTQHVDPVAAVVHTANNRGSCWLTVTTQL